MNIAVTDENKDPNNIKKSQHISELAFLSRSYQLHPFREIYLAPADIDAVFDTPLWVRRKDDSFLDATRENVDQALMLAYGHGPCIYEMYRATFEFLLHDFSFRSWYDLDYLFHKNKKIDYSLLNNTGLRTGLSSKALDLLEAGIGRSNLTKDTVQVGFIPKTLMDRECDQYHETSNQYHDVDFLSDVRLDTHGTQPGRYRCRCRFNCEEELMKRIKQVEDHTGTPRAEFLPFTSQEEGTRILGARLGYSRRGITPSRCFVTDITSSESDSEPDSRGYPSIIAFEGGSDGPANTLTGPKKINLGFRARRTECSHVELDSLED